MRAEGSGLSACDPDNRAVVKEVFGAAPGEGFIGGLLPDGFEEIDCLAMGEEAQEFPMDAAGCRQEYREDCFVDVRGRIILAILLHLSVSGVVKEQVGIIVAELPIASIINVPAVPRERVTYRSRRQGGHPNRGHQVRWRAD